MDNSCIWITSIKNCNKSNILELISTISLIICIAFFIFGLILIYIIKKKFGFNTINLNSKIYNINEIGTIYIFATHFLRIIYILFLKLNINKIIILIIENIPWILLSFIFLIILITIYNLIQNKNNIIKLSIKNILIWLIISGYYFEKKEFILGHIFLGIYGINMFVMGIFTIYYTRYFIKHVKTNNNDINKKLKKLQIFLIPYILACIIFGLLWIIQDMCMVLDPLIFSKKRQLFVTQILLTKQK